MYNSSKIDTTDNIEGVWSTAKGARKFGHRAITAVLSDFIQLDKNGVVEPLNPDKISPQQKKDVLCTVSFLKEKLCGCLKGRTCVDGSTQRPYITKEESSLITVSTEALVATVAMYENEGRDAATLDVVEAYLNADMDDFVATKIEGMMVDFMVKVDSEKYSKYVRIHNNKKGLYVKILKALYGCIKLDLFWYTFFSETFRKIGFVLNPYDLCVANKVVNNKKCTITWYVDDLKISHVDSSVVDRVIKTIKSYVGKMTVTRGTKHKYVGIEFEFTGYSKVTLFQKEYLLECIHAFREDVTTHVTSSAQKGLFNVNSDDEILDKNRSAIFHSVVQKFLYISKRSLPDL